jgi:hypothetical protein
MFVWKILVVLIALAKFVASQQLASDPRTWKPADVALWLSQNGLEDVSPAFLNAKVDGEVLLLLTDDDLASMGLADPIERKRIIVQIRHVQVHTTSEPNLRVPTIDRTRAFTRASIQHLSLWEAHEIYKGDLERATLFALDLPDVFFMRYESAVASDIHNIHNGPFICIRNDNFPQID